MPDFTSTAAPVLPWAMLLPTALAGPGRHPLAPVPGLTPALGSEAGAPEKELLLTAGNLALVQRAGRRFTGPADRLEPAPAETLPALPPAATRLAEQVMLDEKWWPVRDCCLASLAAYHLPHRRLAWLLRQQPDIARRFLPADLAGERGRWLPGYFSRPVLAGWWLPNPRERADNLWRLRRQRPPGGWPWLLDALRHCTPPQRPELLAVLEAWSKTEPVPDGFQPVLDALYAREHPPLYPPEALARVPGVAPLEHHWRQANRILHYAPDPARLTVTPPNDDSWQADEKQAPMHDEGKWPMWLFTEFLRWVRPSRWAEAWGVSVAEAVALVQAMSGRSFMGPHTHAVLDAWLDATLRFRDGAMARALLALPASAWQRQLLGQYLHSAKNLLEATRLLPGAEQADWRLQALPALPHPPLPLLTEDKAVFPTWLDQASYRLYEPPTELMLRMVSFMRDYFTLPPPVGHLGPGRLRRIRAGPPAPVQILRPGRPAPGRRGGSRAAAAGPGPARAALRRSRAHGLALAGHAPRVCRQPGRPRRRGSCHCLAFRPMPAAPATPPWALLLPTALAGPRRQPFAPLPGLTPALGHEADAAEKQLLLTAANLRLVQRAGQRPLPGPAAGLPPEAAELWPASSPAATELLLRGLGDPLLLESTWLFIRQLYRQQRRLPRWLLRKMGRQATPLLLELPTHLPALPGHLGPWLAATNPRPELRTADLTTEWQPGRPAEQQLVALRHWHHLGALPPRQADLVLHDLQYPASARAQAGLLAALCVEHCPLPASWRPALTALAYQLTGPALHHAVSLVGRLPGNDLAQRAWRMAAPYLRLVPGPTGPHLLMELPTAWDPAWERAGLRRDFGLFKPTHWLQELLASTEPSRWANHWHLTPAEAVVLAYAADPGTGTLLRGWLRAAARYHDVAFARALVANPAGPLPLKFFPDLQAQAWAVLPVAELLTWLQQTFPTLPPPPVRLTTSVWHNPPAWLWLLYLLRSRAPELDEWLLTQLRAYATNVPADDQRVVGQILEFFLRHMGNSDPTLQPLLEAAAAAAGLDETCAGYFRELAAVLAFRRACTAALADTLPVVPA